MELRHPSAPSLENLFGRGSLANGTHYKRRIFILARRLWDPVNWPATIAMSLRFFPARYNCAFPSGYEEVEKIAGGQAAENL